MPAPITMGGPIGFHISPLAVSFAAVVVALVAAIVAPFSSYLVARLTTSSAEKVSVQERIYQAKLAAYDEGMALVAASSMLANALVGMTKGQFPEIEIDSASISLEERSMVVGRLQARGSLEFADAVFDVIREGSELGNYSKQIGLVETMSAVGPEQLVQSVTCEQRNELEARAKRVTELRRRAATLARRDLGH